MQQGSEGAQTSGDDLTVSSSPEDAGIVHDSYLALRFRDFRLLLMGAFLTMFGRQMIAVAIGWELYERTGSALVLGGVGLAQVIPLIVLFLPAGYVADRYSRKQVVIVSQGVQTLAALGLFVLSSQRGPLLLIYGCLVMMGGAQSFNSPANSALVSQVVPEYAYENATTWRSSISQLSAVLGPASGGFLIGIFHGATFVYALSAGTALIFVLLLLLMRTNQQVRHQQKGSAGGRRTLGALVEGLRFLGRTQVMLAAITLDLFAVLLGGATTLLPIYAKDILHVGPIGLGWLQAADSIGAVCMALVLAHRSPFQKAGRTLLLGVTGFGLATIILGLSQWFWLSLLMLFLLGAFDNISVVIRSTLLLVRTPDEMRGRVGSVSSLFIGTSNQLGGFESGLVAQLAGPIVSVVTGGVGTILVVLLVAWFWPEMRRLGPLRETSHEQTPVGSG
ncbi:MAG TPA: MFS transporter [Ktedonobacteraceae bacterium]|nr:MFS transporter [Ktedonobacteraceae bacterium]